MSTKVQKLIEPMEFYGQRTFVPIDEWQPSCPEDEIFKTTKNNIILNVSEFYHMDRNILLDSFLMNSKRSYNNPDMRAHTVHYLNYFEKFYDTNHELVSLYCMIKFLIDNEPAYSKEAFLYDLDRYIMSGPISLMVGFMNRDNYSLNLTYKNVKNPNLQYSD